MTATLPKVWCADLTVNVLPCAQPGAAAADGPDLPRVNELWDSAEGKVRLAGAAGEVLSFQVVVEAAAGKVRSVQSDFPDEISARVFQHVAARTEDGGYWDDALVPLGDGLEAPEVTRRGIRVPSRRRTTFTVELHVAPGAGPGRRAGVITVDAAHGRHRVEAELRVRSFRIPESSSFIAQLNNYGLLPAADFHGLDPREDFERYLRIERESFRLAREHRATAILLPYSQSGRLEPFCAPALAGRGRHKRVADWTDFDRHWGPYLDGSAFRGCRGGEWPVESIFLPVNLTWPAAFENYGLPGYAAEFRGVLGQMAAHFVERGWTRTTFEIIFNHKTSWHYYPWDIDETQYERDIPAVAQLAGWVNDVARQWPGLKLVNRIDSSWLYGQAARSEFGGLIQVWMANRSSHSEDPDACELLRKRGQRVGFYAGTGPVAAADRLEDLRSPWLIWGREADGIYWWNCWQFGAWEKTLGGFTHCFYPGERFGIEGHLPSARLKVLHRGLQDHACLELLGQRTGSRAAADRAIAAAIGCRGREDWYQRLEEREVAQDEVQSTSRSGQAWNTAPRAAWSAAREGIARAIEES